MIHFLWDEAKELKNEKAHGVSFTDASLVFDDPYQILEEDSVVEGEQRLRTIGAIPNATVVLVIHLEEAWGEDVYVRIISARRATPTERSEYEQNRTQNSW